jgi:DNA-binding transcriptional regulator LsrR (DeoR family)
MPEPMPILDLEVALLQTLGLKEVRVVEVGRGEWAYFAVGHAAAQLLLEWLNEAGRFAVGLDGGRAIRAFVEALNLPHSLARFPRLERLEFYALHGRTRRKSLWSASVNDILDAVAIRCHESELGKRVCCRSFEGDAVVEKLDAIFASIGAVDEQNRQVLQSRGIVLSNLDKAVGSFFSQPFDVTGQPVDGDISQALGSVSLEAVRLAVRRGTPVIGLVANPQRAMSALVACRSGLVNCLIADRRTAEALLKQATT